MWGDTTLFHGYLAAKLLAYIAWCYLGLRWIAPERPHPGWGAVGWGVLRLFMGLTLGVGIWLASTLFYGTLAQAALMRGEYEGFEFFQVLTYLAVYVPVRWFEWSLLAILMIPSERLSWFAILAGGRLRPRLWRLGGIALSCLADIPMIIEVGGLPLGRFFC